MPAFAFALRLLPKAEAMAIEMSPLTASAAERRLLTLTFRVRTPGKKRIPSASERQRRRHPLRAAWAAREAIPKFRFGTWAGMALVGSVTPLRGDPGRVSLAAFVRLDPHFKSRIYP